MFQSLFKKSKSNENKIVSPCNGTVHPLSASKDPVFSVGMMGPGCFISPETDYVYSPVDGTVVMVFPTKHAIGLKTDSGIEVVVHMGVDTVQLGGSCFDVVVSQGDKIRKGDLLATAKFGAIRAAGYDTDVFVVLTNRQPGDIRVYFDTCKHGELLMDVISQN
jgi:glucose-specific phosphotransferase system IIA component